MIYCRIMSTYLINFFLMLDYFLCPSTTIDIFWTLFGVFCELVNAARHKVLRELVTAWD